MPDSLHPCISKYVAKGKEREWKLPGLVHAKVSASGFRGAVAREGPGKIATAEALSAVFAILTPTLR